MKKYTIILLALFSVSCVTLQPAVDKKSPVSEDSKKQDELKQKQEKEAAGLLDKAKSLYAERKPAEAAEAAQQLLARFPASDGVPEALYLSALCRYELKQYDLALQNGLKLVDKCSDSPLVPKARKVMADCYLETGDNLKAGQSYLEGLAKAQSAEDKEVLRLPLLGLVNEKLTAGELRILYKTYPSSEAAPAMGMRLARMELDDRDNAEARKILAELQKKYPQSPEANSAAVILAQLKENKEIAPVVPMEKKIGLLAPLTGRFAEYGQAVQNGVEMAFEEYNLKSPEKFKLVVQDTKGDPIEAVKLARYLADSSKVMGVIGEVLSASTIAAAGVCDILNVPLISPTATEDRIATIGPNIFKLNLSLSWQGTAVAQYAVKMRGFKALAVLYPSEGAWEDVAGAFSKEAEKLGAKVVYSMSYLPGTTDFKAQIDKLKLVKVDALFLPASPTDIVMVAPQLAYNQVKLQLLGPESWGDPKVPAQGDVYVEGAIFATLSSSSEMAQASSAFEDRFKKRYGKDPSKQAAQGHDAAKVMIYALSKNPAGREELRNFLQSGDFSGLQLSGQGGFGKFGAQPKARMMTIKNRQAIDLDESKLSKTGKAKADSTAKKTDASKDAKDKKTPPPVKDKKQQ